MAKKQTSHRTFNEILMEDLKDPQEAKAYLKSALEDEDERVLFTAIDNIIAAHILSQDKHHE